MELLLPAENATIVVLTASTTALLLADPQFRASVWHGLTSSNPLARLRRRIHLCFALSALFATLNWFVLGYTAAVMGDMCFFFLFVGYLQVLQKHLTSMHMLCEMKQPRVVSCLFLWGIPLMDALSVTFAKLIAYRHYIVNDHRRFNRTLQFSTFELLFPAFLVLLCMVLDAYEFMTLRRRLSQMANNSAAMQRVRVSVKSLIRFHAYVFVACATIIGVLSYNFAYIYVTRLKGPAPVETTTLPPSTSIPLQSWTHGDFLQIYLTCPQFLTNCIYPTVAICFVWLGVSQLYAAREVDAARPRTDTPVMAPATSTAAAIAGRATSFTEASCVGTLTEVAECFLPCFLRARPLVDRAMEELRTRLLVTIGSCLVVLPLLAMFLQFWAPTEPVVASLAVLLYSVLALGHCRHRKDSPRNKRLSAIWAAQLGLKTALVVYACVVCGNFLTIGATSSPFQYLSFVYMWLARYNGGPWWGCAAVAAYLCSQAFWVFVSFDAAGSDGLAHLATSSVLVNLCFYGFGLTVYLLKLMPQAAHDARQERRSTRGPIQTDLFEKDAHGAYYAYDAHYVERGYTEHGYGSDTMARRGKETCPPLVASFQAEPAPRADPKQGSTTPQHPPTVHNARAGEDLVERWDDSQTRQTDSSGPPLRHCPMHSPSNRSVVEEGVYAHGVFSAQLQSSAQQLHSRAPNSPELSPRREHRLWRQRTPELGGLERGHSAPEPLVSPRLYGSMPSFPIQDSASPSIQRQTSRSHPDLLQLVSREGGQSTSSPPVYFVTVSRQGQAYQQQPDSLQAAIRSAATGAFQTPAATKEMGPMDRSWAESKYRHGLSGASDDYLVNVSMSPEQQQLPPLQADPAPQCTGLTPPSLRRKFALSYGQRNEDFFAQRRLSRSNSTGNLAFL